MKWQHSLRVLEKNKSWDDAIELMEKVITQNPDDVHAYIAMNYLLMNLLVEEDYDTNKHEYYKNLLKYYFNESYEKFLDNPEYLFFTARIAYMSVWYFSISTEQAVAMDFKAISLDPNNIIYRWALIVQLDENLAHNKNILFDYAQKVIDQVEIKKYFESKGAVGEYIFEIMVNYCNHILNVIKNFEKT